MTLLDRLVTFEREFRAMFKEVLRQAFEGHPEIHHACLAISHPDLEEEIIVTLRPICVITEDDLLNLIEDEHLDGTKPFKFKFTILCLGDQ